MGAVPEPRVLAQVSELTEEATTGRRGALWRLAVGQRQLDANVIRLPPGARVAAYLGGAVGRAPVRHRGRRAPGGRRRSGSAGRRGRAVGLGGHGRRGRQSERSGRGTGRARTGCARMASARLAAGVVRRRHRSHLPHRAPPSPRAHHRCPRPGRAIRWRGGLPVAPRVRRVRAPRARDRRPLLRALRHGPARALSHRGPGPPVSPGAAMAGPGVRTRGGAPRRGGPRGGALRGACGVRARGRGFRDSSRGAVRRGYGTMRSSLLGEPLPGLVTLPGVAPFTRAVATWAGVALVWLAR